MPTKVFYYMFGYNPRTGVPIVNLMSKMQEAPEGTTIYWEVKYNSEGKKIGFLDEVTDKKQQSAIRLLHALYKDATLKGTKDINKLNPDLVSQLPKDKLERTPENLEKMERVKHAVTTGKVMEGKTPTTNGHGRGSKVLKRMGLGN